MLHWRSLANCCGDVRPSVGGPLLLSSAVLLSLSGSGALLSCLLLLVLGKAGDLGRGELHQVLCCRCSSGEVGGACLLRVGLSPAEPFRLRKALLRW